MDDGAVNCSDPLSSMVVYLVLGVHVLGHLFGRLPTADCRHCEGVGVTWRHMASQGVNWRQLASLGVTWCYFGVTLASRWHHSGVTLALRRRHIGVTLALRWRHVILLKPTYVEYLRYIQDLADPRRPAVSRCCLALIWVPSSLALHKCTGNGQR